MKKIKHGDKSRLALAVFCLGGVVLSGAGHAAVIKINITAEAGISGLTSRAYRDTTTILASAGWAGDWKSVIVQGDGGAYDTGDKFLGFCTDIGNSNGSGTYDYVPTNFSTAPSPSPTGDNNGYAPDPSWANGGTSGQRASLVYNNNVASVELVGSALVNGVSLTQAERRSALAIAIWESLYESVATPVAGSFDVTTRGTGRGFIVTGSGAPVTRVLNAANFWLTPLNSGGTGSDLTWFKEQMTPDVQSLIGPPNPVPEPATYIAGALLLLPLVANTLRARRKQISRRFTV